VVSGHFDDAWTRAHGNERDGGLHGEGSSIVVGMTAFVRNSENQMGRDSANQIVDLQCERGEVKRGFLIGNIELSGAGVTREGESIDEFSVSRRGVFVACGKAICAGVSEVAWGAVCDLGDHDIPQVRKPCARADDFIIGMR